MVLCVAARVYYQDEIQLNYIGKYCISLVIVQPNRYTAITRKIKTVWLKECLHTKHRQNILTLIPFITRNILRHILNENILLKYKH